MLSKKIRQSFFFFFLLSIFVCASQDKVFSSLEQKTIPELYKLFRETYSKRNFSKSIFICTVIVKKATKDNDVKAMVLGYSNLGYSYIALDKKDLARKNFLLAYQKAKGKKNKELLVISYSNLAAYHYQYGKHIDSVFYYYDKSFTHAKKIKNPPDIVSKYLNAVCIALEYDSLAIANRNLKAVERYFKLDTMYIEDKIAFNHLLRGRYHAAIGNYKTSNKEFLKALENNKINNTNSYNLEIYKAYSENLYKQKRYRNAYKKQKIYQKYLEEDLSRNNYSQQELEEKQEQLTAFEKEIEVAEALTRYQAENIKIKDRFIGGITIMLIALLILTFSLLKTRKKREDLVRMLKNKNRDYFKAKEYSEKLTKEKNMFFSTVSHELRTPLYGVIGITSMLTQQQGLQKFSKELRDLNFSADHLLSLINNVLKINMIDSGKEKITQSTLQLTPYLEQIISSLHYLNTIIPAI